MNSPAGGEKLKVLISGAGGLVGSEVCARLSAKGHRILKLVRRGGELKRDEIFWDPIAGFDLPAGFSADAVVHLAGEPIVGRWSEKKKWRIRQSRVRGTESLCRALGKLAAPPKVLVCASAVGFYGARRSEKLVEGSAPGHGFLAEVAQAWEGAASGALSSGARVVNLRIGLVLSRRGGALKMMLPAFKLGLGGVLGDGTQYMSWIALDDLVSVIEHALIDERYKGPINCVAPQPVTNRVFTAALAKVLGRPAFLPVPSWVLKCLFGELAEEALLSDLQVYPEVLKGLGFEFEYAELEGALGN
ncbi:MAG: TIGR01777 family protein [Proteobacteria bacterium]|nr:MAG: TIGR01777 family protein [Pseudomonadota bacterium]